MSGLGSKAQAFLEVARLGDEPRDADRARIRAALAVLLAMGASTGLSAAARSTASASGAVGGSGPSASRGWGTKALVALCLLGAVGGAAAIVGPAKPQCEFPSVASGARSPLGGRTRSATIGLDLRALASARGATR